jgi:hypothetical protein
VNCTTVRDRLAEHALGALPARDAAPVDRHLAWCAACRKEAGELQRATATLAFAAAPIDPPAELEDRVAAAVHESVARRDRRATPPRRSRLMLVAALAAMLAVLGTGWGAVMAGRAARSDRAARIEEIRRHSAIERFSRVISTLEFLSEEDEAFVTTLVPASEGASGGSALTLVSPTITDMAIVIIDPVPEEVRDGMPYAVRLRSDDQVLMIGRIDRDDLDDGGSATVTGEYSDLAGFDTVIVRDADGGIVMQGTLDTDAALESPGP